MLLLAEEALIMFPPEWQVKRPKLLIKSELQKSAPDGLTSRD